MIFQYFQGPHVVSDLLARVSDRLSDITQLTGNVLHFSIFLVAM